MKKLVFLLVTLFPISTLFSQHHQYCGFDEHYEDLESSMPGFEGIIEYHDLLIRQRIDAGLTGFGSRDLEGQCVLPVVFHVLETDPQNSISDMAITQALNELNAKFNGTDIQFCLAQRDPDDMTTTGINRVDASLVEDYALLGYRSANELELKQLSRWSNRDYINVWLVHNLFSTQGILGGVSTVALLENLVPPNANRDGIVLNYNLLGDSEWASLLTHEMGHYLGLRHTFQGDDGGNTCPPAINDDMTGDRIEDTPPHRRRFFAPCNPAPIIECENENMDGQRDVWLNFMNYQEEMCKREFTPGQINHMQAVLMDIRATLLNSIGCVPPCEGVAAQIDITGDLVINEDVTFTANPTNAAEYTWYIDGEEVSNNQQFTQQFFPNGSYRICLDVVGQDECLDRQCEFIYVGADCQELQLPPCELLLNGDFESNGGFGNDLQIHGSQFDCEWISGYPFFACDDPLAVFPVIAANVGFSNSRLKNIEPFNLELNETYTLSFDYLLNIPNGSNPVNLTIQGILFTEDFSHINNTLLPDNRQIIANIVTSEFDIDFPLTMATEGKCEMATTDWRHAEFIFAAENAGEHWLLIKGQTESGATRFAIDNISINECSSFSCTPISNFTFTNNDCTYDFDEGNVGDGEELSWSFGDGGMSTDATPTHTYNEAGEYTVCLTVTCDANVVTTSCQTIIVDANCVNNFPCPCEAGVFLSDPMGEPILASELNYTQLQNTCLAIDGEFIIDVNDFTLNNVEVIMQPCSRIVVHDGSTLNINNQSHLHSCGVQWSGVMVEPNATLLLSNSKVEDAFHAVHLLPLSRSHIYNNDFDNNYVGVYANGNGQPIYQNLPMRGNQFHQSRESLLYFCDGSNPETDNAYAGVVVDRTTSFFIGAPTIFPNTANTFDGLHFGVLANQSVAQIRNANMTNIRPTASGLGGNGVDYRDYSLVSGQEIDMSFVDVGFHGLESRANVSNCEIDADLICLNTIQSVDGTIFSRNTLTSPEVGIQVTNSLEGAQVQIEENHVTASDGIVVQEAIVDFDPDRASTIFKDTVIADWNIRLHNAQGWIVDDNLLKQESLAGILAMNSNGAVLRNNVIEKEDNAPFAAFGMMIWDGADTRTCCNYMQGQLAGLRVRGASVGTDLQTSEFDQIGLRGLQYANMTLTGDQINRGNEWNQDFTDYDAIHLGGDVQADLSPFIAHPSQMPHDFFPALAEGNTVDWFRPTGDAHYCELSLGCDHVSAFYTSHSRLDSTILTNEMGQLADGETTQWEAERYLFKKLWDNPYLRTGAFSSFYTDRQSSEIGQLENWRRDFNDLVTYSDSVRLILSQQFTSIKTNLASVDHIDSVLLTGTEVGVNELTNQRTALMTAISDQYKSIRSIQRHHALQIRSGLSALESQIQTISTLTTPGNNAKQVYGHVLSYVKQGGLFAEELAGIHSIATQCPYEGGTAVHEARSLYNISKDTLIRWEEILNCPLYDGGQIEQRKADDQPRHNGVLVFPNPAREELTISWQGHSDVISYAIFDMDGNLIRQEKEFDAESSINVAALPTGLYILEVKTATGESANAKFTVIK